jgi:beta-lactamase regulating signal transducer with metallopeptidase domain
MNLPLLLDSPVFVIMFKWTCLLGLGWLAHWTLRNQHARWRLILWRSILCCGLVLPLLSFVHVPGIRIPIVSDIDSKTEFYYIPFPKTAPTQTIAITVNPSPTQFPNSAEVALHSHQRPIWLYQKPFSWIGLFYIIWSLGFVIGAIRLVRLQLCLARLQNDARPPTLELQQLTQLIQNRLNVQLDVELKLTDAVASPFVCGLMKPTIILPQTLLQQLSLRETSALLGHEVAHLRQHDLVWCVAWRSMKTVCWFHPLVWGLPAAHNLACEEEADRIASGQLEEAGSYAQLLARLALHVLKLPAVETKLTLNGSSHIVRRLKHLGQRHRRHYADLRTMPTGEQASLLDAPFDRAFVDLERASDAA